MKWICGNPLMGFTQQAIAEKPITVKQAPSFQELPAAMDVSALPANGVAEAPLLIPGTGASSLYALAAIGGVLPVLGFFSTNGGTTVVPHTPGSVVPEPTAPLLLMAALPLVAFGVVRRRRIAEAAPKR
jgi:hypothetical protein